MAGLNVPRVAQRFVAVDEVRVFSREAGPLDVPTMLVLHGFPSASHQCRRLSDALGGRYRLIALDSPGFGHSDAPAAASVGGPFADTFDRLADVIEGFCARLGLDRFVMDVFDFGAPVGFHAARRSRSTWPSTTISTSHSTRAGRPGCASTPADAHHLGPWRPLLAGARRPCLSVRCARRRAAPVRYRPRRAGGEPLRDRPTDRDVPRPDLATTRRQPAATLRGGLIDSARSARLNHVFCGSSDNVRRDVRQVLAERVGIR